MAGRFLLSLLFLCQGLLLISATAYTEEDGVKVQETGWVEISADLTNMDDNTTENSQGIDEDEAMLEDLQLTDDDDDSDGDDMMTKFDDDSVASNNEDIPEDNFPQSEDDVSANLLCRRVPLTVPFFKKAVCRNGVPTFERFTNNIRIPSFRRRRFRLYGINISGTKVGSCSVTGGSSQKTVISGHLRTKIFGRYRLKRRRGSVRIRVSGVSVRLSFNPRTLRNGCPALSNLSCNARTRSIKVKVRGRFVRWVIKFFRRTIGRKLRGFLNRKICNLAKKLMLKKMF